MSTDDTGVAKIANRRRGRYDRRVAIPTDDTSAGATLERELRAIWAHMSSMEDGIEKIATDVEVIRSLLEKLTWRQGLMWAAGVVILSGVVSSGFYLATRHFDRMLTADVTVVAPP